MNRHFDWYLKCIMKSATEHVDSVNYIQHSNYGVQNTDFRFTWPKFMLHFYKTSKIEIHVSILDFIELCFILTESIVLDALMPIWKFGPLSRNPEKKISRIFWKFRIISNWHSNFFGKNSLQYFEFEQFSEYNLCWTSKRYVLWNPLG